MSTSRQTDPVVSVIIPAHDAIDFLPEALATAQGQTLREIEIIVVDDGSRDSTWALLQGAAASDPRVRPLRRKQAGGVSGARNLAMSQAQGRWIAPLDADDLWLPDRLARLVPQAEQLGADLLADDLLLRDFETGESRGRMFGPDAISGRPLTPADLLLRDMPDAAPGAPGAIGYAKPLIRRAFVERHGLTFDPGLTVSEDLAFYFACVAAGARFRMVEDALYVYRQRRRSLSRRGGIARQQAEANRRMAQLFRKRSGEGVLPVLARRQDLLDRAAVAEAAAEGSWLDALLRARWTRPGQLAADLRVVIGAARRRLAA
jgi:glycosyltransferase involved in cell wall biosynthesis